MYSSSTIRFFLILFLGTCILTSCKISKKISRDFNLFQKGLDSLQTITYKPPVVKPFDQLQIQVFSKTLNQEQAALFNMGASAGGGASSGGSTDGGGNSGYAVDENGFIQLPILEKIAVAGLTIDSVRQVLLKKLVPYIKEPDVIVRFSSFKIQVLGEVETPGIRNIPHQRTNVLDVLSLSGGLTELARRDSVIILREDSGRIKKYVIDLRDAAFMNSPVYQLQQNDIVYALPEQTKLENLDFNGDTKLRRMQQYFMLMQFIIIPLTLYNVFRR